MANVLPLAQVGFSTTVDIIHKQGYGLPLRDDTKRHHGHFKSDDGNVPIVPENTDKYPDFKRPRVDPRTTNHLTASKIETVNPLIDEDQVSEYTQRRLLSSTPGPSQHPLLSLAHPRYGLPSRLVKNLNSLGINSIYPWQSSCILNQGVLQGEKNLVYTAPTGGGKSLIADIHMLKRVIEDPMKKGILVLPYVALVQEKLKWLRQVVDGVERFVDSSSQDHEGRSLGRSRNDHRSIRVVGFHGGSRMRAKWVDFDIAICTIEKAHSLINSAIEECTIRDLRVVVLDELHMVDDDHRGYLLEIMATKLLTLDHGVQIIGMSATLSNTEVLAEWLNAKYYQSNYRPVPVKEYLVYDNSIYPASSSGLLLRTASQLNAGRSCPNPQPDRIIRASQHKQLGDALTNAVVSLAIESATAGYGALVFCGGRQSTQGMASLIGNTMPPCGDLDVLDRRKEVSSSLRSLPVGIDETLEKSILQGVAFHHAGLTTEEREIVHEAYIDGTIKVIVATCSLAAGLNLPARRVILQGARMGRDLIGPAMLRQMRGRAGRKGKDEVGESFLCCRPKDLEDVAELLEAELPPIQSCLKQEKRGIKRALLEVITIRLATHRDAIDDYVQRTLLYRTMDRPQLDKMVEVTIAELLAEGLIILDETGSYEATPVSQAIVAASLTPEDGIFVYGELQRARRAFVMDGDMHVFYMFTPIGKGDHYPEIDWKVFRQEMEKMDDSGLRAMQFVGINPGFVNRMANCPKALPERTPDEITLARIYRRFYTAFQLRDLSNEVPVHVVARKYDYPRGLVQNSIAQVCEGFAAGMIKFCERLGWGMLKSVLEHMSDRLKAGAKSDLLELAAIPFVKSRTARVFWENGLKNVRTVAEFEPKDIVPILLFVQPKKGRIDEDAETRYHQKLLGKAQIIVESANRLWERQQQVEIEADL